MKKHLLTVIILSACLSACASSPKETMVSWPTNYSDLANDALTAWSLGQRLDTTLTEESIQNDPEAHLLWAEDAAQRFEAKQAMSRYVSFIQKYPDHRLTTTAITRLKQIAVDSDEPLPANEILAMHVDQPFAKAMLTRLQSKAVDYINTREMNARKLADALPLTQFSWVGPFTPYALTEADIALPSDSDDVLAESYDYEGRTLNAFRYATTTSTQFKATKLGLYVGETGLNVAEPMDLLIVIASPNGFEASFDNASITPAEYLGVHRNDMNVIRVHAEVGHHTLRVKLAKLSSKTDNAFEAWLIPIAADSKEKSVTPKVTSLTESKPQSTRAASTVIGEIPSDYVSMSVASTAKNALNSWAYNVLAIDRRDMKSADTMIKTRQSIMPNDVQNVIQNASRMLYDADFDEASRIDQAISSLESVNENAPELVAPYMQLASLFLQKHYTKQAFDTINDHRAMLPQNVDTEILYSRLYDEKEWFDDAHDAIRTAYKLQPDSCSIALKYLEVAKLAHDMPARQELSETIQHCPRVAQFYAKNGYADMQMLASLETRYPDNVSVRLPRIMKNIDTAPDDAFAELNAILDRAEMGAQTALSVENMLAIVDAFRVNHKDDYANKIVERMIDVMPNEALGHYIKWILAEEKPFAGLRKDSLDVIKKYVETAPASDASSIIVLDYAASKYFESGASMTLTHTITRVLDKDGKSNSGEIYLPENAAILNVRTIKQDTYEIVEPESIGHKRSISAPNLGVGDFIDVEYVTWEPPASTVNRDQMINGRFYFGVAGIPLVHSEYAIEYPANWDVKQINHSTANFDVTPVCNSVSNNTTRCTTVITNIAPFIAEPASTPADDILPFIQYVSNYSWNTIQRALAQKQASKTLITPYVTSYLKEIQVPAGSIRERAQYIYDRVIDDIDEVENDDFFATTASQAITRRTGSRLPTIKALYDAAGIPAHFALLRTIAAPEDMTYPAQEFLQFYMPAIVVDTEEGPAYVQTFEDFVPFDYVQPEAQGLDVVPLVPDATNGISRTDPFEKLVSKVNISYDIDETGSAIANSQEILEGDRALMMRYVLSRSKDDPEQIKRIIERSLARSYGRIELSDFTHEGLEERNSKFKIKYVFEAGNFGMASDDTIRIQSGLFNYNLTQQYAPLANRRTPMLLSGSALADRTLTFNAPQGYKFDQPTSPEIVIHTKFGNFERRYTYEGSKLVISETIELRPQRIAPADYADFRAFCNAVDEAQSAAIQLHK